MSISNSSVAERTPFSEYLAKDFSERIRFLNTLKNGVNDTDKYLYSKEIDNFKAFEVLEQFYKKCNYEDLKNKLGISTTPTQENIHNYCKEVLEVIKTLEQHPYTRENEYLHGFFAILKLVFFEYLNLIDLYMPPVQLQSTGIIQEQQEVISSSSSEAQIDAGRLTETEFITELNALIPNFADASSHPNYKNVIKNKALFLTGTKINNGLYYYQLIEFLKRWIQQHQYPNVNSFVRAITHEINRFKIEFFQQQRTGGGAGRKVKKLLKKK